MTDLIIHPNLLPAYKLRISLFLRNDSYLIPALYMPP